MRIGWVSVSPYANTGYGRMTREIVSRLLDKHDVVCIAQSDNLTWGGKQIVPLPNNKEVLTRLWINPMSSSRQAADMLRYYTQEHKLDLLIGHWDVWAFGECLRMTGIPYLLYIPIDGTMTQRWANYCYGATRTVLYSKFGYNEASKFIPPSKLAYIPHGVDCHIFRPMDKTGLRASIKADPPVPEDCFLFLNIAANVGPRKLIPQLMSTFARFTETNKRAHLYLHTNPSGRLGNAYDLYAWRDMLGMNERIHFPAINPVISGEDDEAMARLYNAADVYVSNSVGEGFGLPLLEAQACGVPVIAPDNTSQAELVGSHYHWKIKTIPTPVFSDVPIYVPTMQTNSVPDQSSLLGRMHDAASVIPYIKIYGDKARDFALGYNWPGVKDDWFNLLDEIQDELEIWKSVKG
jgi:glycosyltransferase involved in cell wall biosynthesis